MQTLAIGQAVDHYTIRKVLGSGGFGVTYLAEDDEAWGKLFAIKEFFPRSLVFREGATVRPRAGAMVDFDRARRRFLDEARTLGRFKHPNIVKFIEFFEANNTAYMVLEYQEGRTFRTWLREIERPPTQTELDKFLVPLMDALKLIHRSRIFHRDIAPDNIYIRDDGSPVLLDFGSASHALRRRWQIVSADVKSGYSPPEQYDALGETQGPWTDIYALAATLYYAVTGESPLEAVERVDEDNYARLATIGGYRREFLDSIDWALAVWPEDRPQTIDQWRTRLLSTPVKEKSVSVTPVWNGLALSSGLLILVAAIWSNLGDSLAPVSVNQAGFWQWTASIISGNYNRGSPERIDLKPNSEISIAREPDAEQGENKAIVIPARELTGSITSRYPRVSADMLPYGSDKTVEFDQVVHGSVDSSNISLTKTPPVPAPSGNIVVESDKHRRSLARDDGAREGTRYGTEPAQSRAATSYPPKPRPRPMEVGKEADWHRRLLARVDGAREGIRSRDRTEPVKSRAPSQPLPRPRSRPIEVVYQAVSMQVEPASAPAPTPNFAKRSPELEPLGDIAAGEDILDTELSPTNTTAKGSLAGFAITSPTIAAAAASSDPEGSAWWAGPVRWLFNTDSLMRRDRSPQPVEISYTADPSEARAPTVVIEDGISRYLANSGFEDGTSGEVMGSDKSEMLILNRSTKSDNLGRAAADYDQLGSAGDVLDGAANSLRFE